MFRQSPSRTESDYAKWMLQDPPVNFTISTRGDQPGLDHLGIQVESGEELQALQARASEAELALLDEGKTTCCYARSDKYWVKDPQGLAWEQFHTLDDIPVFRESLTVLATACCTPAAATVNASCCTPAAGAQSYCRGPTAGQPAASPKTCG